NFSVSFNDFNILVGPNNSGKSTVIDGLKVLAGSYRYASKYKLKTLQNTRGKVVSGLYIPETSIPINLKFIHTDYSEEPTVIEYRFSGKKTLIIEFTKDNEPLLYTEGETKTIKSTTAFKQTFPLNLSIVPTLGPLEEDEKVREIDYVSRFKSSHRAPRLFRNIWYHDEEDFNEFKDILEKTWSGMSIEQPKRTDLLSNDLTMFCYENRIPREVFLSGNGFQIWLQLLTHLIKSKSADLIVIDEPEIYLHPDLQRKLITILRDLQVNVVIATHSIEIINEVEPDEVLVIEKRKKFAKRLTDLIGLQDVVEILGSTQNIHLTRLARGKRVLFVEGQDSKYLEKFAKILGYLTLFNSGELTVIPINGASQWEKIGHADWAFSGVLREKIMVSCLFDRDYKTVEQVNDLKRNLSNKVSFIHVLEKKEIENYLLIPSAIGKAITAKLKARAKRIQTEVVQEFNTENILLEVTDDKKNYVMGQLIHNEIERKKNSGISVATIIANKTNEFEENWSDLFYRLSVVPGKELISSINKYIQSEWKISISPVQILQFITKDDLQVDGEIPSLIKKIDLFVKDDERVKS
ncbi:ATP-dependent nuclease, partial [Bacillus velezensis]|uniref:ATP-dependent nuclease n=4 Tax=Bacillaceae TaxID=186817 RepID=UPI003000D296